MRLHPTMKLNSNLDNQEEELSFMLPVEPIPQPEKFIPCPVPKCPPTTHSRDDSFEFSSTSSTASEQDQEIIFCGRILTGQRTDPSYNTYDDDINNLNGKGGVVSYLVPADLDHCLYKDPPSANTTPLRPLLMGHNNAGRSKSFNHRSDPKPASSSKPKLGQSKSFCYMSKRVGGGGGGLAKAGEERSSGEGKKTVAGEGEAGGAGGRGFGRSKSFRKSVSFSSCFPIVSGGRPDF